MGNFVYFCPRCGERDVERSAAAARSRARVHNNNMHSGANIASFEPDPDTGRGNHKR